MWVWGLNGFRVYTRGLPHSREYQGYSAAYHSRVEGLDVGFTSLVNFHQHLQSSTLGSQYKGYRAACHCVSYCFVSRYPHPPPSNADLQTSNPQPETRGPNPEPSQRSGTSTSTSVEDSLESVVWGGVPILSSMVVVLVELSHLEHCMIGT